MSNPTSGTLRLSDGLQIERCNPSFIWSDDSRFLAVTQWRYCFGLPLRQRILIIDTAERIVYASKPLAWFLQPETFESAVLIVTGETVANASKRFTFTIPEGLRHLRKVQTRW
jgi:hypothetical protein